MVRGLAACCLCAALAGCAPDSGVYDPSRLCVDLPAGHVRDAAWERALVRLETGLGDIGYSWSSRTIDAYDTRIYNWYLSKPRRGEPYNHVKVIYYGNPERYGQVCDVRVDVYPDMWRPQGELEWRTFFRLRDHVLPAVMPGAAVEVLDHPGLWTSAWEVPGLAARFAPGEALPPEVQERLDAYEERWAVGRWWERSTAAMWMAWKRTGGAHVCGAGMYFAFPLNWAAFAAFALAVLIGRKVVKSRAWRTAGFVTLAVVLLMPVKVPTFVGWIYMPHGFVQVYDFDPHYYFREPGFALVAALVTAGLAWLLLRLVRRRRDDGAPS